MLQVIRFVTLHYIVYGTEVLPISVITQSYMYTQEEQQVEYMNYL